VEAVDLTPPALKLVNHSAVVLSVDESRISEALQRCNGCDPSRIASRSSCRSERFSSIHARC
jgi:hypothetical protein